MSKTTYLQRGDEQQRFPFFYAFDESKNDKGCYEVLCVSPNEIEILHLSRGFFNPYVKITKKEFDAAYLAAQQNVNDFYNKLNK